MKERNEEINQKIKEFFPNLDYIPIWSKEDIERLYPQLFNIFYNVIQDYDEFYIEMFGKKILANKEILYNLIYIINLDVLVEYNHRIPKCLFKLQSFLKKYFKKTINFISNKKFKIITSKKIYKFSLNQIILDV